MSAEKIQLPKKCLNEENIWNQFSVMVNLYNPIDLTLGYPDFPPSEETTRALAKVANSEVPQDTHPLGQTNLLEAVANLYSVLLQRNINPQKEIITMSTGCQSLYLVIMALVEQNDEVIIIEPYFTFYETLVNIAGGKCRFVPLRLPTEERKRENLYSSQMILDYEELKTVFNDKTKIFILNTPNNPSGKIFTLEELSMIADLCKKWNVVCIADEVYEFFVYPPNKHIRIASLGGMWERTITLICPGKTFGVTGWELGVAYASEDLVTKLQLAHQNIVHSHNVPIQEAYAVLYKEEMGRIHRNESIFHSLPQTLCHKRDTMLKILRQAGMKPIVPEGGFFILANWSTLIPNLNLNIENEKSSDFQFAEWMIKNVGLAVIPASSFYSEKNKHLGKGYVRLCFYKKSRTLEDFEKIMKKLQKMSRKDNCIAEQ